MGTLHFLYRINRKPKHLEENIKKPPEANAGNSKGGPKELLGSQTDGNRSGVRFLSYFIDVVKTLHEYLN